MPITDLAVFRDPDYPSCWIDDKAGYPDRIASFLEGKGLRRLNANQLRGFMIEGIEQRKAFDRLVVFSQDVVPDTVTEDYFANTTFREYLDAGGSVLWIGDIPLFYVGKQGKVIDHAWQRGSPLFMLGVVPVFANAPEQAVTITREGMHLGLKYRWSGIRPILRDTSIKVLAESESVLSHYYVDVPEPRQPSRWERFLAWVKGVRIGVRVFPPEVYAEVKFRKPPMKPASVKATKVGASVFHGRFANAWMINYNEDYPNSGFYRIWDYGPRHLADTILEELYNVVQAIPKGG